MARFAREAAIFAEYEGWPARVKAGGDVMSVVVLGVPLPPLCPPTGPDVCFEMVTKSGEKRKFALSQDWVRSRTSRNAAGPRAFRGGCMDGPGGVRTGVTWEGNK